MKKFLVFLSSFVLFSGIGLAAQLEILTLDEATPQIIVPQVGVDSYLAPVTLDALGADSVTNGAFTDGADLVTNGSFTGDTDWTKGDGWTLPGTVADSDASQSADSDLTQALSLTNGEVYSIVFTGANRTAGNVTVVCGDTEGTDRATNATFTELVTCGAGGDLDIRADLNYDGDVDDVTLALVGDAGWTQGTGWLISGGDASSDGTQSGDADLENVGNAPIAASQYEVVFTVTNYSAGNVTPVVGNQEGTDRSSNATFTEIITASNTDILKIRADLDFIGDIDDVTMKLITDEVAFDIQYVTNKGGSGGDDVGLRVNQTDTASPGTSLLAEFQADAGRKLSIDNIGSIDVYNAFTDDSNYERLNVGWTLNGGYLRTQAAGTGIARALNLQSASDINAILGDAAGSDEFIVMDINSAALLAVNSDGLHVETVALDDATGNEVAHVINYTTNKSGSGDDTGLVVNQIDTASPGTSLIVDFQVSTSSKASIDNVGLITSDSLTASEIVISDASKGLVSAAVATYPSLAELIHVKGVTSAIQTQLDATGTGDLLADGTIPLTANWDVGAFDITGEQFHSDIATGTSPFTVASTTVVTNLNADQVDGKDSTDLVLVDGTQALTANWDVGSFDLTAQTITVDGDTAASDPATMGYTTAEGLILTGQGSTNDVTIKNDADGDVITIPTGTANLNLLGEVSIGGVTPVSGTKLLLPQENDAATPTLAFGDGNTGFFESADNKIGISLAGVERFLIEASFIGGAGVNSGAVSTAFASTTIPSFIARKTDGNTGIGWAAEDQLSLIAGASEILRLSDAGNTKAGVFTGVAMTSGGTDDVGFEINQTLNDTGAAGGSDEYRMLKGALTSTDVTGWDSVFFLDFLDDSSSVFSVTQAGAVTSAGAIVGSNLSGTNTGDQTSIVGITGTGAQFDTAVTDENFAFSGGAFHDGFSDFVANEHIDWTSTSSNFSTTGTFSSPGPSTDANGLNTWGINAGLTADVGSAQGNGVITSSYNEYSTVGTTGDAATLPSAAAGIKVTIMNNGVNSMDVFPASGDNAGGGVDTAVALAAGSNIVYLAIDVTNWETL